MSIKALVNEGVIDNIKVDFGNDKSVITFKTDKFFRDRSEFGSWLESWLGWS